jgi:predicted aspartyl protease
MARRESSSGGTNEAPCARPNITRPSYKLSWTLVLLILTCSLRPAALGGDIPAASAIPDPPIPDIPIKLYQQYLIVVEGRVGSLEHQHLLIDTGSSPSMIDTRVSARLGLQSTARSLSVFNKNVTSQSVVLPDLQLGPLRRQNLEVMVADFSKIGVELGTRIDAVIGLDVLGATSFTVDYAKRRIVFQASSEKHTAPFTAGPQFITVNVKSGGRQLHLLFDTGTPHLVLFQDRMSDVDFMASPATGKGQNVSGDVGYGIVTLQQARIGTLEVGPQRAAVVASQKNNESDLDGLLGVSCLHPKRLSFDFEKHLLGWSD